MTPMEARGLRRAGVVLLLLSLSRLALSGRSGEGVKLPGDVVEPEEVRAEALREMEESRRRSAALAPGEKIDPNRDGEVELDRLPGVGPALARAWVQDRAMRGGYRRAEDLLRVPGIGPAVLSRLLPYLDFSAGVPVGLKVRESGSSVRESRARPLTAVQEPLRVFPEVPDTGPRRRKGGGVPDSGDRVGADGPGRLNVNRATAEELIELPGIGPALARRIVESRQREGPFPSVESLQRVKGIGGATLERIRRLVTVR